MAEHGTITGYRKLGCRKTDNCPATPTCAQVKAGTRVPDIAVRPQAAPGSLAQPAQLAVPPGAQGIAVREQWADLEPDVRSKVAVLLAAAEALAYVIDYGATALVAPAVKALRDVENDIQSRMEGKQSDEFDRLMASLADVSTPVRNPAELGA